MSEATPSDAEMIEEAIRGLHEDDRSNEVAARFVKAYIAKHFDRTVTQSVGYFLHHNDEFGGVRITDRRDHHHWNTVYEYELVE